MKRIYAFYILILALIAIPITLYLLQLHYFPGASFCNVDAFWDCNSVNTSKYAKLFSVPVALWGTLTYIGIALWMLLELRPKWLNLVLSPIMRAQLFTAASGLAFLFSLYLTIIELTVIHAVCMLCLAQQFIILGIFIIAVRNLITIK